METGPAGTGPKCGVEAFAMNDATHWGFAPQRLEGVPNKRTCDEVWINYRTILKAVEPLSIQSGSAIKHQCIKSLFQIAQLDADSKSSSTKNQDNITGGNYQLDQNDLEDEEDSTTESKRTANIYQGPAGEPRGAAVWISSKELTAVGVDVDEADAVEVRIEDGDIQLASTRGEDT